MPGSIGTISLITKTGEFERTSISGVGEAKINNGADSLISILIELLITSTLPSFIINEIL